ncbi:ATP-binding cassette sub- A member 1 [Homalodisca vitripennis]|nr:ATP-binding cassette sub- A member 1 [Homalodisca vitripennis]
MAGGSSESHIQEITEFVRKSVPSARLLESVGEECTYLLPQGCNQLLPSLFKNLDISQDSLHVRSYGISDTSLEEIFLRVTEDNDPSQLFISGKESFSCIQKLRKYLFESSKTKPLDKKIPVNTDKFAEKEIVVHRNGTSMKYLTIPVQDQEQEVEIVEPPSNKNWRQFLALHIKRFHHTRRNKKALFSELIIPALFVCVTLIVTSILPELRERPPLPLNPWIYPAPRYMFYSMDSQDVWARKYQDEIRGPYGIGAVCLPEEREEFCVTPTDPPRPVNISQFGPPCSCASGAQICPADSGKPDPPSFTIASDDTMYDMTGSNISDWILKTQDRYDRARSGGFSLGVVSSVPNWNLTEMIQTLGQIINSTIPNQLVPAVVTQASPANFSSNNVMVWFFNKAWASSVAYMNALNNVVLRASVPTNTEGQFSINTINHPMNYTKNQLGIEMISTSGVSLLHAIAVLFALSFVPASFTLYLIEERVSNSKHLQMVSGVNRLIYWLEAYAWDMLCYLLAAALCVFVFLVFNEESYVSATNFPGLIALLVLYGWSCVALMYPFSFYFDVPSSAFVALACCNMFVGIITTITTFVLSVFDDEDLKEVADVLQVVFLVFPHYCLGSGLLKLATSHIAKEALAAFDINLSTNIFAWGFLGKPLLCMFVTGVIFFLITLGVEFNVFKGLLTKFQSKASYFPSPTSL